MVKVIVEAVNNFVNPLKLAEISKSAGAGHKGISADMTPVEEALQERGW